MLIWISQIVLTWTWCGEYNALMSCPVKIFSTREFPTIFSFLFFWDSLRDPIACSLLDGGIPSQNSGYKITRLCTYLFYFDTSFPRPQFRPVIILGILTLLLHSTLLHSTPLHLTRSLHSTLFGLNQKPTLNPSLPLPPFSSPAPILDRPVTATVETPSPPASEWTVHRGP